MSEATKTSYFFELFDAALMFHAADLSLSSLTKSPNRTILLKDLATTKSGEFILELYKFICFVISDNGRELLVSRQCKLKFHHSKADVALTKVLMYADSRCRLQETHSDWVAKCMKFWNKKQESEPSKSEPSDSKSNEIENISMKNPSGRGLSPERVKAAAHRKAMSLSRITPETFDFDADDNLMASPLPAGRKASRSMNAMEMGALRYLVNENAIKRDAECESPMSHLSYSKAYKQEESPMRPLTSSKKHGNTNNPLLIDPKKVLSQMEEERRNTEQVENEIGELKARFDATLTDRDSKIDRLSAELESKETKLSQSTSAFRVAESEKVALEKALAAAKEMNEKLQSAQEKEFSGKKKDLLLKASQFKKMSSPVLKDKNSTIEGINESKTTLYKALNLMSAFPFHTENFATANSAATNSVVLNAIYPPDLASQNFNAKSASNKISNGSGCPVKSGRKLLASTVEVVPRVIIDSSLAEGLAKLNQPVEIFYTLILSDLDHISTSNTSTKDSNGNVVTGEYVQWMMVNIPAGRVSDGTTLLEYIGPAPEYSSGLHRLLFSLYKQNGVMNKATVDDAKKFYATRFVSSHSWIKDQADPVPVALNAFTCEWDQNVDYFHNLRGYVPPPAFRSPLC